MGLAEGRGDPGGQFTGKDGVEHVYPVLVGVEPGLGDAGDFHAGIGQALDADLGPLAVDGGAVPDVEDEEPPRPEMFRRPGEDRLDIRVGHLITHDVEQGEDGVEMPPELDGADIPLLTGEAGVHLGLGLRLGHHPGAEFDPGDPIAPFRQEAAMLAGA